MGLADYIKNKLPYWPNAITYPLMRLNVFGGRCYGRAYMNFGKTLREKTNEQKLLDLVNHAIKHVPYYRRLYGDLQVRSMAEFEEKIGFIDKDTVMAHWDEFVADGADISKCVTATTGGTSGKPLKILNPRNRYVFAMYFWHKQLKAFGWNYHITAVLRNHRLPSGRDYIINPVMRQMIFDAFRNDDAYYKRMWQVMRRHDVGYLHAYPSAAYSFLKSCSRQSLDTSFIKALFLTSEAITEHQRHFIADSLGIDILGSYGHSEKLCQAGTMPGDFRYHIDEEYGLTELTDRDGNTVKETGIVAEITGTTFNNPYFPLIRYRTGDYASYAEYSPRRILNSIEGRWDKSLIYRADGTTTTITALNLHNTFLDHIAGLQYVQERKGHIVLNIIKDAGYNESDHRFINDFLADAMGGSRYVTINYVDKLQFQSNGKFLPLISLV